jgi:hypothetical protein
MPTTGDLFDALSRIAASVQTRPAVAAIWEELRPWMRHLGLQAAPKWVPRIAAGFPCKVPLYRSGVRIGACPGRAVAECDVCRQTCCLQHARIDQFGEAICFLCVAEARAQSRRRRPSQAAASDAADEEVARRELQRARKVLGVKAADNWQLIQSKYKQLSFKFHPDRHRTPAAKQNAAEKFKEVQWAYKLLDAERTKREAA